MASTIKSDNGVSSGVTGIVQTADSTGQLALQTTTSGGVATTAVTIDNSQNVGIGTATPAAKIDAFQSTVGTYFLGGGGDNKARQLAITSSTTTNSGDTHTFNSQSGTGILAFAITGSEKARIDTSGNWMVGTATAIGSGKTSIVFPGATANAIEAQDSGTNSNAGFFSMRNSGGTQIGSITRVGTTNAVVFNTTSDERLKSNIADSNAILDKLLSLKVRQFDWTEGELHQDYGFIAQEIEPVLSGIVTKGKTEEDVWQLDYSRLTPHLVKAIQELSAEVTALKAKLGV
jgi:hypothetical protein